MSATVLSCVRSFFAPVRLGAALGSLLLLAACGGGDETSAQTGEGQYVVGEPLSDPAIAVVVRSDFGTDTLGTSAFEEITLRMATQYGLLGEADAMQRLRRDIVREFVLRRMIFGEARQLGIAAAAEDVERQMQQIKMQFPDEETFQQALAGDNLDEEELRRRIADDLTEQALIARFAESAEEPDAEAIEELRRERAEEVRASHILFIPPPGATDAQQDSTLRQAEAVLDSIRAGADFAEMARRHSQGPSGPGGGDLGFFGRGDMVEPFEEAAYALSDSGDVTREPVESRFGQHLIQLTGRRAAAPMDSSLARQRILRERQRDAVEAGIDRLRAGATVHINPNVADVDLNAAEE